MPEFKPRRGAAAIVEAATRRGGGGRFSAFVPEIRWTEDGEKKYILVLSNFEDDDPNAAVVADLHEFIQVGVWEKADGSTKPRYESFVSRKDPLAGGEDYDDIQDRLGRDPKTRVLGVAVELEPTFETRNGRRRPVGFSVKTDTFTRKTDDGEEEVVQPLIGIISQSAYLMWGQLQALDESQGPLAELPIDITRRGKDANTNYSFVQFFGAPVDLSALFENLDGVSYLRDELENIEISDDKTIEDAQLIAQHLLDKRLTELADRDRYEELVKPIDVLAPPKWGNPKKSGSRPASRPARTSPRETGSEEKPATKVDSDAEARFAELRARIGK